MKNILFTPFLFIALVFFASSCTLEDVPNPNVPDQKTVAVGATKVDIQSLINGLESRHRAYVGRTSQAFASFGREVLVYRNSDPRFTQDWLGRAGQPDAGFFLADGIYNSPYAAIKQGNFILEVIGNTAALNSEEENSVKGYIKTLMSYQYLIALIGQGDGGIRFDVKDPQNIGAFLSYEEAAESINTLVDEALTDLNGAGSALFFVPSGLEGIKIGGEADRALNVADLIKMNRAIKTRVALYSKNWDQVETAANASFMNLSGDLNMGIEHVYTGANGSPNNPFNPLFNELDKQTKELEVAHRAFLNDAAAGDTRITSKLLERSLDNGVVNDALPQYVGTHQDKRFASNTASVKYLRNEEIILNYAEALAQQSKFTEAVSAINVIRNAAGIGDYTGTADLPNLITEILEQRRYSLWFEPLPHRWQDLRRYDRLSDMNDEFIADNETLILKLARPQNEQ